MRDSIHDVALDRGAERCCPVPYFGFARRLRQLNGEIANGGALHVATMDLKSGGLLSEPVEQSVATATADDIDPTQMVCR